MERVPNSFKALGLSPVPRELGVESHTHDASTWEVEARGAKFKARPQLCKTLGRERIEPEPGICEVRAPLTTSKNSSS